MSAGSTPARAKDASRPERLLVLLRVEDAEPAALARALGLVSAEATHRVRRGGWQLLRIAEPGVAEQQAQRLRDAGLRVALVAESQVRAAARPVVALGGEWTGQQLSLRTSDGPVRLESSDLLIVVQGPISREYQTLQEVKRSRTATLEGGYRFHLHRRGEPRPVELDPGAFDFGAGPGGLGGPESPLSSRASANSFRASEKRGASSLLQLSAWVQELGAGVSVDDGFRRLPPELGVAAAAAGGPLAAADALGVRPGGRGEATLVLDNLRQFRFYSAWRAALER